MGQVARTLMVTFRMEKALGRKEDTVVIWLHPRPIGIILLFERKPNNIDECFSVLKEEQVVRIYKGKVEVSIHGDYGASQSTVSSRKRISF